MNRQEQMQFIDRELKGLWPQWQPTEAEVRVWLSDLAAFDYAVARTAAQGCFRQQAANYHRPILGKFLEKARALARPTVGGSRQSPDVTTDVFIECRQAPAGKPHLVGVRKPVYVRPASRQTDRDYVLACAEHMRTQFEHLYGGRWITVRTGLRQDARCDKPQTLACPDKMELERGAGRSYASENHGVCCSSSGWIESSGPMSIASDSGQTQEWNHDFQL